MLTRTFFIYFFPLFDNKGCHKMITLSVWFNVFLSVRDCFSHFGSAQGFAPFPNTHLTADTWSVIILLACLFAFAIVL